MNPPTSPPAIAHILPWPEVGGTEQATLRIARTVREHGYRNVAFCLRSAPRVQELFRDDGVDVVPFDPVELSLRRPGAYVQRARELTRALRSQRVDIMHCSDVAGALHGAAAGKLARIPVVSHVRNQFDMLTRRERTLLAPVDQFVFVSQATWRSFSHAVGPRRGRVLYDATPTSGGRDAAAVTVRSELGLSRTTRLVGMVARVSPQKDFETLARAAAAVLRSHPDVRFVVVGDIANEAAHRAHYARVRAMLEQRGVSDAFIFTGFRADVERLVSAFDVAVLSTHWEGLPLSLIESMALGIPTVATSVAGIPEVIVNADVGLLFPPGDDAALAHHLLALLTDERAARRIGAAGQSHVRETFSQEAFASNLLALYQEMLDPSPARTAARAGLNISPRRAA